MSRFYKIDETEKAIHVIIGKKGYGKTYFEEQKLQKELKNKLIDDILTEVKLYHICIDERVTGIEVFNAIVNIINDYKYK